MATAKTQTAVERLASVVHSAELVGAGNRWEPHPLPSWWGGSPELPGTAAAAWLWPQTQASLHSPGPGSLQVRSAFSSSLALPHSSHPLQGGAKLCPSSGAVATQPGVCTDMPAPCCLNAPQTLSTDKLRREVEGRLCPDLQAPLCTNSLGALGMLMAVGGRQSPGQKGVGETPPTSQGWPEA